MNTTPSDQKAIQKIQEQAQKAGFDLAGAKIRRSSSRFCFGVEHGDYNGTELFGVGTDRFIWLAYKPNQTGRVRLLSANFPEDGVVEFTPGSVPPPKSIRDSWSRFPFGVDYILQREGYSLSTGFDAVIYGNIPGGGMSRSASLALNLILTMLEVNGHSEEDGMRIVDLAQAVENDYIGSPCGQLDQIMIFFARAGNGTHYNPTTRTIEYIPLGEQAPPFCIASLDTGTVRPGLEKSTYKIRRTECEQLVEILHQAGFEIKNLAELKTEEDLNRMLAIAEEKHPHLCQRGRYIFEAQKRFYAMLSAWRKGDIETVGKIFRQDGIGLRDQYCISGPELESMCDISRTVPGVLGERMLGGGDKGAAGALLLEDAADALRAAVECAYPRSHPEFSDRYAVHICKTVDGITLLDKRL
jgi:galactokinase